MVRPSSAELDEDFNNKSNSMSPESEPSGSMSIISSPETKLGGSEGGDTVCPGSGESNATEAGGSDVYESSDGDNVSVCSWVTDEDLDFRPIVPCTNPVFAGCQRSQSAFLPLAVHWIPRVPQGGPMRAEPSDVSTDGQPGLPNSVSTSLVDLRSPSHRTNCAANFQRSVGTGHHCGALSTSPIQYKQDDIAQFGQVGAKSDPKEATVYPSCGSQGHPFTCGLPCKYAGRHKGCRDGAKCQCCHLCQWTRKTKHMPARERMTAPSHHTKDLR